MSPSALVIGDFLTLRYVDRHFYQYVYSTLSSTSTEIDLCDRSGDLIQVQKGDILGHEAVGIIESVGPNIKKFKAGDVRPRAIVLNENRR